MIIESRRDIVTIYICSLSADGQRAGVQAESKIRGTTQMSLDEAQKILDVHPNASLAEIRKVRERF